MQDHTNYFEHKCLKNYMHKGLANSLNKTFDDHLVLKKGEQKFTQL